MGFEPTTTCLASKSSTTELPPHNGGDKRVRTADPLNANQVLSQLSYIPKKENNMCGEDFRLPPTT